MRKCRFCDKEIRDTSRVCEHCGKDLFATPASADAPGPAPDPDLSTAPVARVTVVDIDMPFGSMIGFMLKWMLASIPAFVIFFLLFVVLGFLFGGLLSTCHIPGVR